MHLFFIFITRCHNTRRLFCSENSNNSNILHSKKSNRSQFPAPGRSKSEMRSPAIRIYEFVGGGARHPAICSRSPCIISNLRTAGSGENLRPGRELEALYSRGEGIYVSTHTACARRELTRRWRNYGGIIAKAR